jgi:hypothetical protein
MDGNESSHATETSGTNNEVLLDTSLASPAFGQYRKCTKCEFQFSTKGIGRGNYKVCHSCRAMDIATNTSQTDPKQQKRTNEEVISPSSTQQGAAKKPHSLPAQEPKAHEVFVNNLLCTDEKALKEMNHNELIDRVIAVAKAAKKYQGQLQQAQSFLKEAK